MTWDNSVNKNVVIYAAHTTIDVKNMPLTSCCNQHFPANCLSSNSFNQTSHILAFSFHLQILVSWGVFLCSRPD